MAHSTKLALALFASGVFASCGKHDAPSTSAAGASAKETPPAAAGNDAAAGGGGQKPSPGQGARGNPVFAEFADAAKDNDLELIKARLHDDPGLVSIRNANGGTLLHQAAFNGQMDVAALLLANGADVNARNYNGGTPLHGAANSGHLDVAGLLLAKGADVNASNNNGATPLHLAQAQGRMAIAALLRENGGHE